MSKPVSAVKWHIRYETEDGTSVSVWYSWQNGRPITRRKIKDIAAAEVRAGIYVGIDAIVAEDEE